MSLLEGLARISRTRKSKKLLKCEGHTTMAQSAPAPALEEVPPTAIVFSIGMAPLSAAMIAHSIATFIPTPKRHLKDSARTSVCETPENLLLMERSRPERIWLCFTTLQPVDSSSLRISKLKCQTPGAEEPGCK